MKWQIPEKFIHDVFDVGLVLKAIDGTLELLGGALLFFMSPSMINRLLIALTQGELVEDPHDKIAQYLFHLTTGQTSAQQFIAFFLFSHGVIKIFIVIALLKNKLWAYPFGIIIFGGFGVYQLYRYAHTHGAWLLILTILDAILIWLTWHEWRLQKKRFA